MKISIASSFALISILVSASGPAFASDINDLIPRSTLEKFCADKPLNSKHSVQMTLPNGTAITGIIECELEYLNSTSDDDEKDHDDDDDNNDHDDDDNDDNNDHDDDDDDHDDD